MLFPSVKICSNCKQEKTLIEFRIKRNQCKQCERGFCKQWHSKNREPRLKKMKVWQKNNPEFSRRHYLKHQEKIKEKSKKFRIDNPDYTKSYYESNLDNIVEYRKSRKEITREYKKEYEKQRKSKDPLYKLISNVRNRLNTAFREILNTHRNKRTFEIIGLTSNELKHYIETKFTDGMNWENQGQYKDPNGVTRHGWDVDHIIPVSLAKTELELLTLCHYTNLQPLWHIDNIKKGNKINKRNYSHDYQTTSR